MLGLIDDLNNKFITWKVKLGFDTDARADLYDQIAAKLENRADLQKLIAALALSTERFTPGSATAIVLQRWAERMGQSIPFAKAVRADKFIPAEEMLLIAAGAESGKLPRTLRVASNMLDTKGDLITAYIVALFMPVAVILASIVTSVFFCATIIPMAIERNDKNMYTGLAAAVIQYGDFILSPAGPMAALVIFGVIYWIIWSLQRTLGNGNIRLYLEKIPPWSMYKDMQSYIFLSTLAALLSVFSDLEAITYMCGDSKNNSDRPTPYMLQRLEGAMGAFNGQGAANVADALEKSGYSFPSPHILGLLYEYAGAPDFAEAIQNQAERLRSRMLRSVKKQSIRLNLYAMGLAAAILGMMFSGFYELIDQMGGMAQRY